MITVGVAGAAGRMGQSLVAALAKHDSLELVLALERAQHPDLGKDSGTVAGCKPNKVPLTATADGRVAALIDFSRVEAVADHLRYCTESGSGLVLGTTGLDDGLHQQLRAAARHIPIVWSPNMSLSLNLCLELLETAAAVLPERDWDIEIVEAHHRFKRDVPSGTALRIGEIVAQARYHEDLNDVAEFRSRGVGDEREPGSIGFSSIRGGGLAGEHSVLFLAEGESMEIRHRADNRMGFVRGALLTALWMGTGMGPGTRPVAEPGLYSMADVLKEIGPYSTNDPRSLVEALKKMDQQSVVEALQDLAPDGWAEALKNADPSAPDGD